MTKARTLYDKIWDEHVAHEAEDGTCRLYIDRHLVHEVTSPQAFEGLRMTGRKVRAPEKTIAVPDHNVPTTAGREDPKNMTEDSAIQVAAEAITKVRLGRLDDESTANFGIIGCRGNQNILSRNKHYPYCNWDFVCTFYYSTIWYKTGG